MLSDTSRLLRGYEDGILMVKIRKQAQRGDTTCPGMQEVGWTLKSA